MGVSPWYCGSTVRVHRAWMADICSLSGGQGAESQGGVRALGTESTPSP